MRSATRYILASVLITVISITLFGLYTLKNYHNSESRHESIRLEACIRTFWELLHQKGSDFRVVDNRLLLGNYVINGNYELPDRIQDIFGGVATIFMGDERVSTNVLTADGRRAVGTRLAGPAYEAVFRQDRPYRGTADILGVRYVTAYDPIRDRNGKTIGALFVGVKESDFLARMHGMKNRMTLTLVTMLTVLTFLMILLGRSMKRIEADKESRINFQNTLMDTIPTPIFYKDASGRYLGCNRAFEEYTGFTLPQLRGKSPHDLWPKELAENYHQQDLAMFENPGYNSYETVVRHADGTLHDAIFNKATFSGADGSVAGLVGVILDITGRKAHEDEVTNAYQRLFDIVEFLPDATFVIDRNRRVIAWNRAIETLTGVPKGEMLGKGQYAYAIPFYNDSRPLLIDLLGPEMEQERIRRNYTQIRQEGQTLFTEVFVPAFRNGGSRYFWATATPLYDRNGQQVGAIESIRDITEYKQIEDEKIRLESQLAYARLMETIMIRLGHDLKTPLTPLFILLTMLKNQITDPAQIDKLETCLKCAASIKGLAEKAGILARLSSSGRTAPRTNVFLAQAADQAMAAIHEQIARRGIECRNLVADDLEVQVVEGQLHELLGNLLANAVSYSREGGIITLSAEREHGAVLIAVRDEGTGIAPEHLAHVFDEFFKADESRHNLESSGLGLTICKRIADNHHGRIWAESEGLGCGTTVYVEIRDEPEGPSGGGDA